jgi:type I restriction enzyme S subunit
MKDSGIEWLGKVPKHWTVATVRRIIEWIEQGWSPDCFARPAEPEEWGVVKSGCVNRGVFVEDENKALPENLEPVPEYEIHEGDVLMSRASGSPELVGSTAYILQTRPKLMLSDKIFRIHLEPQVDKKFFVAVFNSRVTRSQIERAISGADGLANNLPQSAMKTFFCAIPPLAEQKAIVAHLEVELGKFDTLTAEAQRAIDLLQERRTALISAAVTGQIDVRRLGASLSGDIAISKSKP